MVGMSNNNMVMVNGTGSEAINPHIKIQRLVSKVGYYICLFIVPSCPVACDMLGGLLCCLLQSIMSALNLQHLFQYRQGSRIPQIGTDLRNHHKLSNRRGRYRE